MKNELGSLLSNGDLRSTVDPRVLQIIKNKIDFEILLSFLDNNERHIRMHAVDAIEKISLDKPQWLNGHKYFIFEMMEKYSDKEFRWHIAQVVSRLHLDEDDTGKVWDILTRWLSDCKESRIVRVFSLQSLFEISKAYPELALDLEQTVNEIKREKIPSLNARIRKLGM